MESRFAPLEAQAAQNTERIAAAEANAQKMQAQMEENAAIAKADSDRAMREAERANNRINGLDDFDPIKTIVVKFATGSSTLGPAGKKTIDDAAAINRANNLTGAASVGESFGGWYIEGGYEITPTLRNRELSITPHVRYDALDTQRSVPSGFSSNRENDQNILTLGVAFKPIPQTVIKLDWQDVDNEAGTGIDQWNIALGYIF